MPKNNEAIQAIDEITDKLSISMRGITKIVRVARTIADLENSEDITKTHIIRSAFFRQQILNNN